MSHKPKYPPALKTGDHIRVIAPTGGIQYVSENTASIAAACLEKAGFKISFGKNTKMPLEFTEESILARLHDLHEAFSDSSVHGILSLIGGLNSIQLVSRLDYRLLERNPKFFCGYSDITAVQNAITTRAGFVTFSGPHFQTFGIKKGNDFTVNNFLRMASHIADPELPFSTDWSDDAWYQDQDKRDFIKNTGPVVLNAGTAEGLLVGGNLSTIQLLGGTDYMLDAPSIVLALEEDSDVGFRMFDRMLESMLLNCGARVKAILLGRFQKESNIEDGQLKDFVATRPYLQKIPVVANMDFGHTNPMLTLPLGGSVEVDTSLPGKIRLAQY